MAHGFPDYGVAAPSHTIYTFEDIGELATRLGSPDTFDRRGNVIWLESFEDTLNRWDSGSFGAEGDFQHTAEASRSGSFSAKLLSATTVDKDSWIWCYRPLPVESKIGIECSYAMYLQIKYLYLILNFIERNDKYEYELRYDRYNTTLAYLNSGGTYTDLPGRISTQLLYHTWNTIKLVVDYENKKYVRALINSFSFDLSDISGKHSGGVYTECLMPKIMITNRVAGAHYLYLDDIILTQNEP